MEVRGKQPERPNPTLQRFEQEKLELIQEGRTKSREAREALSNAALRQRPKADDDSASVAADRQRTDRIELSQVAREAQVKDEKRTQRVEDLRQEHLDGSVNTPERVEKASQRLLGA